MDDLSAHWTGPDGGASAAFGYHMRRRWTRGFASLADAFTSARETYEWMANAYEDIVNSFLGAQLLRPTPAQGRRRSRRRPAKAAWSLIQLVNTVIQLVTDTVRLIEMRTRMFASAVEMMVANLHSMAEILPGDLDVFSQA